ncbi:MAG: ABC transporter ATP-binding protein [Myxococcota bacterium]
MADEGVLVGKGLSCGYSAGAPVLEGVDVTVREREILAILGGSGSGKSTLLKTLGALLPPLEGKVELFGQDLYGVGRSERRGLLRRTGTLFQSDALFGSMSALDNVALPVRELADVPDRVASELALAKLALVGLSHLASKLPSQISGGQRKRVALARAVVLDPGVLYCDEPTSGLDPQTAASIDRTLLRFRDVFGLSIVAVTHDKESIRTIADRALVLGDEGVCADGPVSELEQSDHPTVRGFFHRPGMDPNGATQTEQA